MIVLRKLALEETGRSSDFGDMAPPAGPFSPIVVPQARSDFDRLKHALKSGNMHLIMFGLQQLPRAVANDKACLQLLSFVTVHLFGTSKVLEYSAIICVTQIARDCAGNVAAQLLTIMLDRINESPACEYIQCLVLLIPFFTDTTLNSCVYPLFDRFMEKRDSFHYAAGELITKGPLDKLKLTQEQFARMLKSRILVDNYLEKAIKEVIRQKIFNDDWIERVLPTSLVNAGNTMPVLQRGISAAIICLGDFLPTKQFLGLAPVIFEWAEASDDVALALLSRADEVVTPRTTELFPPLRQLLIKLCATRVVKIKATLPSIIAGNPSAFLGGRLDLESSIAEFAADPKPEVRAAFIDNFPLIFLRGNATHIQDRLFTALASLLDDPDPSISRRMCSAKLYVGLGSARIFRILPAFIRFVGTLNSWRDVSSIIDVFVSFPSDVIRYSWREMLSAIFKSVADSPTALGRACQTLMCKIATNVGSDGALEIIDMLYNTFAKSQHVSMRKLFARLVTAFCFPNQLRENVDVLWKHLLELSKDKYSSVRASIIPHLMRVKHCYAVQDDTAGVENVTALFNAMEKDPDPYVVDVRAERVTMFNRQTRSSSDLTGGKNNRSQSILAVSESQGPSTLCVPTSSSTVVSGSIGALQAAARQRSRLLGPGAARVAYRSINGVAPMSSLGFTSNLNGGSNSAPQGQGFPSSTGLGPSGTLGSGLGASRFGLNANGGAGTGQGQGLGPSGTLGSGLGASRFGLNANGPIGFSSAFGSTGTLSGGYGGVRPGLGPSGTLGSGLGASRHGLSGQGPVFNVNLDRSRGVTTLPPIFQNTKP